MQAEARTSSERPPILDADALYQNWQNAETSNTLLKAENDRLRSWIVQMKRARFGRSSEKISFSEQDLLPGFEDVFNETYEDPEYSEESSVEDEETPKSGRANKSGRRPLPAHLPREQVIHDIKGEKICSCGHPLHKIGSEISEQLDYVPAQLKVIQNVRLKYGCKGCEEGVKLAELKSQPIPKSIAAPGLLANILVSKFQDHLPLYRQSQIWERVGVDMGRGSMSRWVLQIGDLLAPLRNLLRSEIVKDDYARADETTTQVLNEPGRKATSKSYMWIYMTGNRPHTSIVYEYQPTRKGENAAEFLTGFQGYLQTDGYSGYKTLTKKKGITSVGCWAHARRKFIEIIKSTGNKTGKAGEAVKVIKKLYDIEREVKEDQHPPDKIKALRQEKSKPILEAFKKWLEDHKKITAPKSPLGGAIGYALNQWGPLTEYLNDGRLNIDNNICERAIRPFAVGRKNWLFMGNVQGAQASSVIYSLIETCKANKINTFDYLSHVLENISSTDPKNYSDLLPWNFKATPL